MVFLGCGDRRRVVPGVLDTGSTVSILPLRYLEDIQYTIIDRKSGVLQQTKGRIEEFIPVEVLLKIGNKKGKVEMLCFDTEIEYCLLSMAHICAFDLSIDFKNLTIRQNDKVIVPETKLISSSMKSTYSINMVESKQESLSACPEGPLPTSVSLKDADIVEKKIPQIDADPELTKLLDQYGHIFSKDSYDVGEVRLEPVKVELTSELPVSIRPYRCSPADNKEIESQINKLLEANFIKPSHSPYSAPVTLAFKKNEFGTKSKTRMCIDFRKLNLITKTDSNPIPRIDAMLDELTQAKYFSTLDLVSGYWHLRVRDEDTHKLAMATNFGLYEWLRLPFGWKNSASVFQRTIRQVLNKYSIKFALNYFDDIIVFSGSLKEHLDHLRKIFNVCEKENIKLKRCKCEFAKTTIRFLGYDVSGGRCSPSNVNIEAIKKLIPPKNVKELQRFLGSVNVYHRFIKDYARLRGPLNKLLKKDSGWVWSEECQQSFESLRDSLISKPVLHLFNPNYKCHLFVDASQTALGAVLKQEHPDGELYPISYHSRQLQPYERNYTVTELECLAIVDALDKYLHYLHGSSFIIHTDHAALVWLRNVKHLTGRLFRWSLKLSMFDYEIRYKKGAYNHEPDMLSRSVISHHNIALTHLISGEKIKEHQFLDNVGNPKFKKVSGVWTVSKRGLVKVVVPYSLREELIAKTHQEFGHPGVKKMISLISPHYYWEKIITDISNYVKHCETCQLNKMSHLKKFGLLQAMPPCREPFEVLSLDSVGGFNYYNSSKKYLHILIDHATRFIWTFTSKNITSEMYANLLKQVFNYGTPKALLTDRNPAFTSARFRKFLQNSEVKQLLTSAHHPQTNGKCERVNQSIVTRLKCKVNASSDKIPWTRHLEKVTLEYNNTPHSITSFPPAYLMYGTLPFDSPIGKELYPPLDKAREIAMTKTKESHEYNKSRYDKGFRQAEFKEGDMVKMEVFRYPNTRKLEPAYSGPYKILKKLSDVSVQLDKGEIVHVSKLQPFFPSSRFSLEGYVGNRT